MATNQGVRRLRKDMAGAADMFEQLTQIALIEHCLHASECLAKFGYVVLAFKVGSQSSLGAFEGGDNRVVDWTNDALQSQLDYELAVLSPVS